MNAHKNARLTPRGREVLVSRLEDGRVTVQGEGQEEGQEEGTLQPTTPPPITATCT